MKTTDKELATTSAEINEMFDELAFKQAEHSYVFPELPKRKKNAATPVQVVPTSLESSRPNADKLHYRHQPVIKPITGPFIYSTATGIVREQSK